MLSVNFIQIIIYSSLMAVNFYLFILMMEEQYNICQVIGDINYILLSIALLMSVMISTIMLLNSLN
jgi:hypothetical protein